MKRLSFALVFISLAFAQMEPNSPEWTRMNPSFDDDNCFFVSGIGEGTTEREAKNNALNDAIEASLHKGGLVGIKELEGGVEEKFILSNVISRGHLCTEFVPSKQNGIKAYVLILVPRKADIVCSNVDAKKICKDEQFEKELNKYKQELEQQKKIKEKDSIKIKEKEQKINKILDTLKKYRNERWDFKRELEKGVSNLDAVKKIKDKNDIWLELKKLWDTDFGGRRETNSIKTIDIWRKIDQFDEPERTSLYDSAKKKFSTIQWMSKDLSELDSIFNQVNKKNQEYCKTNESLYWINNGDSITSNILYGKLLDEFGGNIKKGNCSNNNNGIKIIYNGEVKAKAESERKVIFTPKLSIGYCNEKNDSLEKINFNIMNGELGDARVGLRKSTNNAIKEYLHSKDNNVQKFYRELIDNIKNEFPLCYNKKETIIISSSSSHAISSSSSLKNIVYTEPIPAEDSTDEWGITLNDSIISIKDLEEKYLDIGPHNIKLSKNCYESIDTTINVTNIIEKDSLKNIIDNLKIAAKRDTTLKKALGILVKRNGKPINVSVLSDGLEIKSYNTAGDKDLGFGPRPIRMNISACSELKIKIGIKEIKVNTNGNIPSNFGYPIFQYEYKDLDSLKFIPGGEYSIEGANPSIDVKVGNLCIKDKKITRREWDNFVDSTIISEKLLDEYLKKKKFRQTFKNSYEINFDEPMQNISWEEVHEFINKLNEETGKNYRLPTEFEWEYAAKINADLLGTMNHDLLGEYVKDWYEYPVNESVLQRSSCVVRNCSWSKEGFVQKCRDITDCDNTPNENGKFASFRVVLPINEELKKDKKGNFLCPN